MLSIFEDGFDKQVENNANEHLIVVLIWVSHTSLRMNMMWEVLRLKHFGEFRFQLSVIEVYVKSIKIE